jgi:hypothetical protein
MPLSVHILHNDRLDRGEHQGESEHSALLLLLIDINKKQKRSKR